MHRRTVGLAPRIRGEGMTATDSPAALLTATATRVWNILIVDDEAPVRTLLARLLRSPEVRCETAPDGPAALERLGAGVCDLVLLDVDMPRMKGTEVCRQLRENPPSAHLKIVMMSGRATGDELAQVM